LDASPPEKRGRELIERRFNLPKNISAAVPTLGAREQRVDQRLRREFGPDVLRVVEGAFVLLPGDAA